MRFSIMGPPKVGPAAHFVVEVFAFLNTLEGQRLLKDMKKEGVEDGRACVGVGA